MDLFSQASNYWEKLKASSFIPLLASLVTLLVTYSLYPAFWSVILVVIIIGANVVVWMQELFTFLVRRQLKRQVDAFNLPRWYTAISVIMLVVLAAGVYAAFQLDSTTTYPQLVTNAKFAAISMFGVVKACVGYWTIIGKLVEKNWNRIKHDELSASDSPALS